MSSEARASSPMIWLLFVAGPVIWLTHFMAVYLLVEAACTVGGIDHELFGLHVLSVATLAATAAAILVTLFTSARAYSHWRGATGGGDWLDVTDGNAGLAFAGFVLGIVSIAAICFVGIPAAFLEPC